MVLHIVAQSSWHDPALIVGTREAMHDLRDAINRALEPPHYEHHAKVFADDGEGYRVHVLVVPESDMARMPWGYTDEIANTDDPKRKWPVQRKPLTPEV